MYTWMNQVSILLVLGPTAKKIASAFSELIVHANIRGGYRI